VLAAGFGTRLRPLSLVLPKPLLPICGEPVIAHTLRQLRRAGCEAAVINLHHLPQAIPRQLGTSCYGLPLRYAPEEIILGTLGALYPVRDFLAGADLALLVNGDALARWPWRRLIRAHQRSGARATLLLHRRAALSDFGGGVGVGRGGRVVELRGEAFGDVARRHVFAGAHVLSRQLLERLEPGPADVVERLYKPLLRDGELVRAVYGGRRWHDLGTPARYLAAALDWARGPWPRRLWRGAWISPLARVDASAQVERAVVEAGAEIAAGCRLRRSLVMDGATVGRDSRVSGCILGPGVELPPASRVEGRLVTTTIAGYSPADHESVIGSLVYTPL